MKVFVLGGNGFVGSAYARLLAKKGVDHVVLQRDNYAHYVGHKCDVLINANGNSRKFMADRDPKWEFTESVASVAASLEDFRSQHYVFLSSGDVYPDQSTPATTKEDQVLDTRTMSRYGLHKFFAEELVRAIHPSWLIMRMGGFVGPGMKKNCMFDILNGPQVWLHPDSELQFIGTDTAATLTWNLLLSGIRQRTLNLGGRGTVRIDTIYEQAASTVPFTTQPSLVRFELNLEALSQYVGELPKTVDEVASFISSSRATSN